MARHKEFERDEALQKAMEVFWARGYEATSMQNLVEHMGARAFTTPSATSIPFFSRRSIVTRRWNRERFSSCSRSPGR